MHGKNIHATATFLDKKAMRNGGFALRKSHGIEIPMMPATTASVMNITDERKIVVQERVCDLGSRLDREVIIAAERHPVTIRDHVSGVLSLTFASSGAGSLPRGGLVSLGSGGPSFKAQANSCRFMTPV